MIGVEHCMRAALTRLNVRLVCLVFCCGLTGCGLIDSFLLNTSQMTAEELVMEGNEAMQNKEYALASKYYKKLKSSYPFSEYTELAEIGLADASFFAENYTQAEEAYKEFESLHPGHKHIDYILLQIGVSNLKQFQSIDLPQDNITEALEYFHRVRDLFPDSSYADTAAKYITRCHRFQAEHEIFVADFYQRREKFLSAWKRYQFVLEQYSQFADIQEYAAQQSRAAYFKYQQRRSEQEHIQRYGSWRQWFDWL